MCVYSYIVFMQCITTSVELKTKFFTISAVYWTGLKCSTYQKTTPNINSVSSTSNPLAASRIPSAESRNKYTVLKYAEVQKIGFEGWSWWGVISSFLTPITGHITPLLTCMEVNVCASTSHRDKRLASCGYSSPNLITMNAFWPYCHVAAGVNAE